MYQQALIHMLSGAFMMHALQSLLKDLAEWRRAEVARAHDQQEFTGAVTWACSDLHEGLRAAGPAFAASLQPRRHRDPQRELPPDYYIS